MELLYDTSIPFLDKDPKESKSSYYRDLTISMFIAALFTATW
jgi:hypothetical protein